MGKFGKLKVRLTDSFVVGVVALVFLIIGFQTALFIHRAAVMKIAANRDEPDTVYVYERIPADERDGGRGQGGSVSGRARAETQAQGRGGQRGELREVPPGERHGEQQGEPRGGQRGERYEGSVRRNASHGARAEAVRNNMPVARVETFRFNPNTVSVEELCRLGFSSRQAKAIDNYRMKGGRFRRKSDFAKSYVVPDSVFRRLEPYIDIPLTDLNVADSASLDALPGIGGWFVSAIIAHRKALGGYSFKEQLMDIYRFDADKYAALEDLVIVSPENVTPYPLWRLPADSLRRHPYIKTYAAAKAIVLYRENNPRDMWTVRGLSEAGILAPDDASRLSKCFIEEP